MSNREPRMGRLSIVKRPDLITQRIEWDTGPNFGDNVEVVVQRSGDNVSIRHRNSEIPLPIDKARLVCEALGNVLRVGDSDD